MEIRNLVGKLEAKPPRKKGWKKGIALKKNFGPTKFKNLQKN